MDRPLDMMVAERGSSVIADISPKYSPGCDNSAITFPFLTTTTDP
jgi:hypothetical protein